ncbi:hypothetical protein [Kaistia sp. MMO-174]|uniref:hypothetical protein n=1 Tax=Kaistia sp. MMO-174 TaxID=3081256 RepID=UPI00301B3A8D
MPEKLVRAMISFEVVGTLLGRAGHMDDAAGCSTHGAPSPCRRDLRATNRNRWKP